ncbi:hypothetical protein ISF6_0589 [Piscinibacter sakaiensis]|uniref:FecR protein domain-containing protein n=3 Tax=Piscinibacter sakaiensis TaxID=1547922 RepID=A0A0K8NXJ8_PISS1|nr:hypothetical protein ISF6_0589 [Piscinibacter sakaiensis]
MRRRCAAPGRCAAPADGGRRRWLAGAAGLLALGAAAGAAAQAGAAPRATVTILDGAARLLRGAGRFDLAEGVRLQPLDIVETGPQARLVRLEFADGPALDLGPETRVLIEPRFVGERGRSQARAYLLAGWAKLSGAPPGSRPVAGGPPLLASPAFDLPGVGGSVVVALGPSRAQAFAEAGESRLQEREGGSAVGSPRSLRGGEFFSRTGATPAAVLPRPLPDFVQGLPRGFLDTLPSRAALFKDRDVPPKPAGEIAYAEARDWLAGEPSLRRALMNRWRPLARPGAFRDALVANMAAHPEWDRVLFPEKYLPRPVTPPAAGAGVR